MDQKLGKGGGKYFNKSQILKQKKMLIVEQNTFKREHDSNREIKESYKAKKTGVR